MFLDKPVYHLLGGTDRQRVPCYCTGNNVEQAVEFDFRKLKLALSHGPVDAVATLCVSGCAPLSGTATVVHSKLLFVFQHRRVKGMVIFPWPIVADRHFRRLWPLQFEVCSGQPVDQKMVDEQLTPRTNVNNIFGASGQWDHDDE